MRRSKDQTLRSVAAWRESQEILAHAVGFQALPTAEAPDENPADSASSSFLERLRQRKPELLAATVLTVLATVVGCGEDTDSSPHARTAVPSQLTFEAPAIQAENGLNHPGDFIRLAKRGNFVP